MSIFLIIKSEWSKNYIASIFHRIHFIYLISIIKYLLLQLRLRLGIKGMHESNILHIQKKRYLDNFQQNHLSAFCRFAGRNLQQQQKRSRHGTLAYTLYLNKCIQHTTKYIIKTKI